MMAQTAEQAGLVRQTKRATEPHRTRWGLFGGNFVVSKKGETYDERVRGPNRKFSRREFPLPYRGFPIDPAVEIQRRYYSETASRYDTMHKHEGADDPECLHLVLSILRSLQVQSLLDVGSANGRGLREFASALPGAFACGVEPVAALVQQGIAAGIAPSVALFQASGDALPFADRSFDAVSEFSTLHHFPNPSAVVSEMLRVARKVVVIVDSNRFGQGSLPARLLKLFLYKFRLWDAVNFLRTRGKRYQFLRRRWALLFLQRL